MSKYDEYIEATLAAEKRSRINFYLNNTELIHKNARDMGTDYKDRFETLKTQILAVNRRNQELNEEQRKKKRKGDPGYDAEAERKKLVAKFPELADPRCFTHPMRPVPREHTLALLENTDGLGTEEYFKLRWSVPPAQRYYFKETNGFEYGWRAPEHSDEKYGRVFNLKRSSWRPNTLAMFIIDKQIAAPTFW